MSSLETGGSVGSKRGKYYEFYLKSLLKEHGYALDASRKLESEDTYYFTYRVPDEEITEIDFHFPFKKVGFWVTNVGRVQKIRCTNCSHGKKYNEFAKLSGKCPHCNNGTLPDLTKNDYSCWRCNNCNRFCDPYELKNKKCNCNSEDFETFTDTSAASSSHKAAYYRITEYLEVKTSKNSDILCSEIIFNEKYEWRIWGQVVEKFFDSTFFVYEDNSELFGSKSFNDKMWNFFEKNLSGKYSQNKFPVNIISHIDNVRKEKNKNLTQWMKGIQDRREKYWGEKYPASFPIRYSIFTVLKTLGYQKFVDTYEIATIQLLKNNKLITSAPMKKGKKRCEEKGFVKNGKVTKLGEKELETAVEKYLEIINHVKNYTGKIHPRDIWLKDRRDLVILVLEKLLKLSLKNGWYKFVMVANRDIKELDATPYINTQFEPLETLTSIFLERFEDEGIISEFEGLDNGDVFESTFLRDIFSTPDSSSAYKIGDDAKIILPNKKIIYLQDKSNTSFKKWDKDGDIHGSGIAYKDFKRMIGHNVLASFELENNELVYKKNRYYVGIIDSDWASTKKDLFRMIRTMYTLGVDEIFFADEIDTKFKEFLVRVSQE